MDYSMLIKTETLDIGKRRKKQRNVYISEDMTEAYHLGIIDFLQTYNFEKKFEYCVKSRFGTHPKTELISCTSPQRYQVRFHLFMSNKVFKK